MYSGQISDSISTALNLKKPVVRVAVFRPALDASLAALLLQLPLQAVEDLSGASLVECSCRLCSDKVVVQNLHRPSFEEVDCSVGRNSDSCHQRHWLHC